eukprot:COSAG01_NODE_68437_length_264_cov_0.624242_1_plen_34_part_01
MFVGHAIMLYTNDAYLTAPAGPSIAKVCHFGPSP